MWRPRGQDHLRQCHTERTTQRRQGPQRSNWMATSPTTSHRLQELVWCRCRKPTHNWKRTYVDIRSIQEYINHKAIHWVPRTVQWADGLTKFSQALRSLFLEWIMRPFIQLSAKDHEKKNTPVSTFEHSAHADSWSFASTAHCHLTLCTEIAGAHLKPIDQNMRVLVHALRCD